MKVYPKWWIDDGSWEFIEDEELIKEWNLVEVEIDDDIIKRYFEAEEQYRKMCNVIREEVSRAKI